MIKSVILPLVCAFVLAGCGDDDGESEGTLTLDNTLSIQGDARKYHLFLPNQPKSANLLTLLHGHGGSADQIIGLENSKAPFKVWLDIAKRENLILIIPDGAPGLNDNKGWNDCRTDADNNPSTNDIAFLDGLIDKVRADNSLGNRKVFVMGISNGGFMTQRLAEEIPEKIAAATVVVSSRPANSICPTSSVPLPIMFLNGTNDPLVPYEGGRIPANDSSVLSTQVTVDHWVARNQTDTTPVETTLANSDPNDGSTIKRFSYLNGANGSVVEHYEVVGGGHTEPSIAERYGLIYKAIVGSQNGDIEMAEEVWNFFERHKVD